MKKFDIKTKNPEEINKLLADAYLNFYIPREADFYNPLINIPKDIDQDMYYMYLLADPNYFYFICKEILGVTIHPFQCVILKELWTHKFPMLVASRGASKSYLLAVYAWLRLLLLPGRKVLLTSASFRQSKIVFNYIEAMWFSSSILRDIGGSTLGNGPKHSPDKYYLNVNDSTLNAVPTGQGDTIRGLRSHDTINDEFAATNREIFETVIGGFAVVNSNPIENIKNIAKTKLAKRLNVKLDETDEFHYVPNQTIIAGTADYDFNHFAEYWKRWKQIIESKGNPDKLKLLFKEGTVPEDFEWKDYSIIRLPIELTPDGLMDKSMVARSKATVHSGVYLCEFSAVFAKDSCGFFKRSTLEKCVCKNDTPIVINNEEIFFKPMLVGAQGKKYVMAIDPASERDNFAIVIVEANPSHRKIVHVWTTNRKQHQERKLTDSSLKDDFYDFCATKIRELMRRFNIVHIGIDSQGGGITILERLGARDLHNPGQKRILPIVNYDDPKPTDSEEGLHIIELIQFSDAKWVSDANHGLRQDFEKKTILFPFFDIVDIAGVESEDRDGNKIYDTVEDCYMEIEELKTELTTIVMTRTQYGRDRWSTPETKELSGKKGRLRKDRYSAVIIAAHCARFLVKPEDINMSQYISTGGFASKDSGKTGGELYAGGWLAKSLGHAYEGY